MPMPPSLPPGSRLAVPLQRPSFRRRSPSRLGRPPSPFHLVDVEGYGDVMVPVQRHIERVASLLREHEALDVQDLVAKAIDTTEIRRTDQAVGWEEIPLPPGLSR